MKNYTLKACEDLIEKYINKFNGQMLVIDEGCLGLGIRVLHGAEGKKTIVIKEIFLNEWSSGHTVRKYNKTPIKYLELINNN